MIRCEWLASNKADLSQIGGTMRAVCVRCMLVFIELALLIIRTITCPLNCVVSRWWLWWCDSIDLIQIHAQAHAHALAFMFKPCAAQVLSAIHLLFMSIGVGMCIRFIDLQLRNCARNTTFQTPMATIQYTMWIYPPEIQTIHMYSVYYDG